MLKTSSKFIFLVSILLFLIVSHQTMGYVIHGRLTGYSPKWKNRIFLAAIRSVNEFESAAEGMQVNEAAIDNLGNFVLQGNNLPEANAFYRVYLTNRDDFGMQLLAGAEHNFIHLLLNNNSDVLINADLQSQPIYCAQITGSPYVSYLTDFYKRIYYIGNQNYYSVYTEMQLDRQKSFELIKNSIVKNNNPYYTIFALAHLSWLGEYPSNKGFFENSVSGLNTQLPGNIYVRELNDKLHLIAFQTSPFRNYLNLQNFIWLLFMLGLSLVVIVYLLFRLRNKSQISLNPDVPTERLTQKELEIVNLVVQGKSNKEISSLLFIEISTVKSHIGNIYQKLDISGRKELADKINAS